MNKESYDPTSRSGEENEVTQEKISTKVIEDCPDIVLGQKNNKETQEGGENGSES